MERETECKSMIVSVYLKAGARAATSYYRFYQYFNRIEGVDFRYRLMVPDRHWNNFFPIGLQPLWKKLYIFIYVYFRVLGSLIKDLWSRPHLVVISRCMINIITPISYKLLLLLIKCRGSLIIYDLDDDVVCMKEISTMSFDFICKISHTIVVGSPLLKSLINLRYVSKTVYIPTTDGDMHHLVSDTVKTNRLESLGKCVRIVWVGTFSALEDVMQIVDAFEILGQKFNRNNIEVIFTVVCDRPLDYEPKSFILKNIKWERNVAIRQMLIAHLGIMPLQHSEENKGKCGFKLIQYLSVGLPVVGSKVGVNSLIISHDVGISVETNDAHLWADGMYSILKEKNIWMRYGNNSYKRWQEHYSDVMCYNKWREVFNCDNN